jgi:ribosomal protein S11
MKISHLQEADVTPSSGPDNMATGQAPKMGRSNDVLETTTSGSIATGEPSNLGTQRRGQKSIFKGIKTSKKFANSRAAGIYEDELSEEQLQAKKRREELFKRSKDRGIGKKPMSRDIMAKEAFNGEYDDEAGMADNNLETMRRAVDGIDSVINTGDNLPEWCQEKIAVAKSMLVNVWDYMRSEEDIHEGDYNNYDNNRMGFRKPRPDVSGEGEPEGMFTVMIDGRPWKEFTSNKAFSVAKTLADKNPTKKIQVKWPNGALNSVNEGMFGSSKENQILPLVKKISDLAGKLNSQNVEVGKKIIQSNTNDIVRMLSPQTKPGIDVIEGGIAQPKTDDKLRQYYADLKAKKQAEKDKQQGVAEGTIDMPFGSISGKDVDIGLQHRSEQAAYTGLKRLGLVDTSEQFLTLQEIAKLVTDTSNIHIFAFDTNPVRSYVKLIKMIGWNKDNPTEYEYNPQDVSEEKQRLDPSCWTGYKKQGTKMKGGVRVNNCVPVKESSILKGLKK